MAILSESLLMVLLMYLSCDCQEEEEKKDEVLSMSMELKFKRSLLGVMCASTCEMLRKMETSVHTFRKEMA